MEIGENIWKESQTINLKNNLIRNIPKKILKKL